jgi:hypothetical protein
MTHESLAPDWITLPQWEHPVRGQWPLGHGRLWGGWRWLYEECGIDNDVMADVTLMTSSSDTPCVVFIPALDHLPFGMYDNDFDTSFEELMKHVRHNTFGDTGIFPGTPDGAPILLPYLMSFQAVQDRREMNPKLHNTGLSWVPCGGWLPAEESWTPPSAQAAVPLKQTVVFSANPSPLWWIWPLEDQDVTYMLDYSDFMAQEWGSADSSLMGDGDFADNAVEDFIQEAAAGDPDLERYVTVAKNNGIVWDKEDDKCKEFVYLHFAEDVVDWFRETFTEDPVSAHRSAFDYLRQRNEPLAAYLAQCAQYTLMVDAAVRDLFTRACNDGGMEWACFWEQQHLWPWR